MVENSVFIGLVNTYVLKSTCNTTHRQNKKLMSSTSEARTTAAKGKHPRSQRASLTERYYGDLQITSSV